MYVQFKQENGIEYANELKTQFYDQIDKRLIAVILGIALFCFMRWRKYTIITCLNRTKEENKRVGGAPYSAHLYGRGVDLRTSHLSDQHIVILIEYLEKSWGDFLFIKYHDSGTGNHLHINIRYKYRRSQF